MRASTNALGQPIGAPVAASLPEGPPSGEPMVGSACRVVPLSAADHGEDLFDAFAAAADDAEWTYLPYGPFDDMSDFTDWLRGCEASTDTVFFAVAVADDAGACGIASYLRIDPRAGSVEVGHLHFAPRLQRTRAATEAMYLMMERVFDAGYRRYEWKCDALNAGSCAAAARLGFTYEGTFRQATVYKGRNRDTAWFSILDTEWSTIRTEYQRWLDPGNFDSAGHQLTPLDLRDR